MGLGVVPLALLSITLFIVNTRVVTQFKEIRNH